MNKLKKNNWWRRDHLQNLFGIPFKTNTTEDYSKGWKESRKPRAHKKQSEDNIIKYARNLFRV